MAEKPVREESAPPLTVRVTKPKGQAARRLAELDVAIMSIEEDEGDVDRFIISPRLAVDRWTSHRFLNGIMDKSLFTSAIYLREHFRLPVLIVEGEVDYEYRGFDPQAVRGALSSMMLEYSVNVLATRDLDETAWLLAMMARQEQVGIPEISLIPKRTAQSLPDMQRRVVEMLPGCGRVMARELLQHFGSIERIVDAKVEELCELRGIGTKKAQAMRRVLAAEYEAVDTEKQIEDAIAADPGLLFDQPVELLARQHHIYDDDSERHIVDMVFRDPGSGDVVFVELKRGRLEAAHEEQLRRYLDHAAESILIRNHIEAGSAVHGVLASPERGKLRPQHADIRVRKIDPKAVVEVLVRLRRERQCLDAHHASEREQQGD